MSAPFYYTDDREFMDAAVRQNGHALRHASDALKADRAIVLVAVQQHGDALQYAAEALKADREVALAAVGNNGSALRHAADALKADREVALAAVGNYGGALQFAAEELRADLTIVTAAVRQDGDALKWAAPVLQADEWLQLLTRRCRSHLPARMRAFLELARAQVDAAVQAQVDLFLIKRGLDEWISAKRKTAKEEDAHARKRHRSK